jgi:uncharacterized protein
MSTDLATGGWFLAGLSALEVAKSLLLEPHREGGFFRETYRSPIRVCTKAGQRSLTTSIFYLMTNDDPSRFHRLTSDELWFYHAGAPLELVLLDPAVPPSPPEESVASVELPYVSCIIGPDLPQALVPARYWAAARVLTGNEADWGTGRAPERRWTPDRRSTRDYRWTLVSCVVTPGFHYDDFELADRETLLSAFPQAREAILALT